MKKTFFALLVIVAMSYFCSSWMSSVRAEETKTFVGTIESFRPTFARPPKWPIARFTAVADNGEKIEVYVLGRDTTVTDIDGKSTENKRPQVGKKAEIKYSTGEHEIYGGMRYEAVSIRYVPSDYVSQPVTTTDQPNSAMPGVAHDKNTLIGTVKDIAGIAPGLSNNWTYAKIVVVADSGNESAFFINKNTALTNEKGVTNPPLPKKDQRVEIKYSIGEDGRNEAVSLRYLLSDTSRQSIASSTSKPENIFTGKVQNVTSVLGRSPNWTYNRISVIMDSGDTSDFFVMRSTVITDADGNNLSGKRIKKGKKVEIKYSILTDSSAIINGQKGADSIRYLD